MLVKVCLSVIQLVNRAWNARERAQCVCAHTYACVHTYVKGLSVNFWF